MNNITKDVPRMHAPPSTSTACRRLDTRNLTYEPDPEREYDT